MFVLILNILCASNLYLLSNTHCHISVLEGDFTLFCLLCFSTLGPCSTCNSWYCSKKVAACWKIFSNQWAGTWLLSSGWIWNMFQMSLRNRALQQECNNNSLCDNNSYKKCAISLCFLCWFYVKWNWMSIQLNV